MSTIPTIKVKSNNPDHHDGFFVRNADDLRYGEKLFMAEEFEKIGEHQVRLKLESAPPDGYFIAEAKLWLDLKAKEQLELEDAARSSREIETLSIAKEANSIARIAAASAARASRYAMYAAIIAATIMIVENHEKILSLIFNNP